MRNIVQSNSIFFALVALAVVLFLGLTTDCTRLGAHKSEIVTRFEIFVDAVVKNKPF